MDHLATKAADPLALAFPLQQLGVWLYTIEDRAEWVMGMLTVAAKLDERRMKERSERGRAVAIDRGRHV